MPELKPKDMIALLVIFLFGLFKMTGHNGTLDTIVALIIGYYFAKRTNGEDRGL